MPLIEDAVPSSGRRARRATRVWWLVVAVLLAGLVAAWCAAASATADGIREHRDYTAAPTCRLPDDGSAGTCTARDRSIGRFRLAVIDVVSRNNGHNGDPSTMLLTYEDSTGLSDGAASFGDPLPPFSSPPDADTFAVIELWQGAAQWVEAPGSTDQYPANGSVVVATRYLATPIMIFSGLYLLLMCALWWRMASRGRVSDHDFGRPLVFLAVLAGLATGWSLSEHWNPAGPAVLGAALVVATLLAVPWPRPDRAARAERARWHGRGGKRGHGGSGERGDQPV